MLEIISFISLIIIIVMLRRIVSVLPSVFACTLRWKENINLDSIVKTSRDRDLTALALTIPFCLTINRFGLLTFRFMRDMSPEAGFGITVGIFITYVLFRLFTAKVFLPHKSRSTTRISDNSDRTFFIILSLSLLACGWIMTVFNADPLTTRHTMFWLSVAIYMLYLVRKFQIFQSHHPIFTSFLYLCALEIIPTGTLVVSAIIF